MILMTILNPVNFLIIFVFPDSYSKLYVIETSNDKIERTENKNQSIHLDKDKPNESYSKFYIVESRNDKNKRTENMNQSIHLDKDYSSDANTSYDSSQTLLENDYSDDINMMYDYDYSDDTNTMYDSPEALGKAFEDAYESIHSKKSFGRRSLETNTEKGVSFENMTEGHNVTHVIKQLDIINEVQSLINIMPAEKTRMITELDAKLKEFEKNETKIKNAKLVSRFVTYTPLAQKASIESRLFSVVNETVFEVSKSWDINSKRIIADLLRSVSERFKKSAETGEELKNVAALGVDYQETNTNTSDTNTTQCDTINDIYRTIDGSCNNIANPNQGKAITDLKRFLKNAYEDGESIPRGGFNPSSLPSARIVSTKLHHARDPNPLTTKNYTVMVMQFGQFLDHDISFTSLNEINCCNGTILSENPEKCFNIDIRKDRFYKSRRRKCHSFTRSDSIFTKGETREQMNMITSFIDGSQIYSSDKDATPFLREGKNGKMAIHDEGPMLPSREKCNIPSDPPTRFPSDLIAGDTRAMIQPHLASVHTLFLNEHNRIAEELKSRLGGILAGKPEDLQDEILFQETRKIIGAEIQNIAYSEFLPIILGAKEFNKHNLKLLNESQYDTEVDASIRNEFNTAAFRFGHTLIPGSFDGNGGFELRLNYFDEDALYVSGPDRDGRGWADQLRGACGQRCPAADLVVTRHIRNFLFAGAVVAGKQFVAKFGDDLISRNIQRGRDHGIPSYNHLRSFCNLSNITNVTQPPPEIKPTIWSKLMKVYDNVEDIDAFTGGLSETHPDDGILGPTFACFIGKQFNFLKFGDRYFFNNAHNGPKNERGLQLRTRETVQNRKLRDIICDNTNITELQQFVMKEADNKTNPLQNCTSHNVLDWEGIMVDIFKSAQKITEVLEATRDSATNEGPETTENPICNFVDLIPTSSCVLQKFRCNNNNGVFQNNCAKTCKC